MTTPDYDDVLRRIEAGDNLLHAAGHGRLDNMKTALARGAGVDQLRSDQSALFLATKGRYMECVELLLDHGADPNLGTRVRWRPLHEAAAKDYPEIVRALVAAGADPSLSDLGGQLPLHAAAEGKSTAALKALLELGANPDSADYSGRTALMAAVGSETDTAVVALLAAGADPNRADANGQTAFDMAKKAGWTLGLTILGHAARRQAATEASTSDDAASAPADAPGADTGPPAVSRIGKRPGPR